MRRKTFNIYYLHEIKDVSLQPIGATFNINGNQVRFAAGNLQYNMTNGTWRFADHQWTIIGAAQAYYTRIASSYVHGAEYADKSSGYFISYAAEKYTRYRVWK